jgi:hypothetical protein
MFTLVPFSFLLVLSSSDLVNGHRLQHGTNPSFSKAEINVRFEEETLQVQERSDMGLEKRQACGAGIGSCPAAQCCSIGGQCGTGHGYCDGPNCQVTYGPACDGKYGQLQITLGK